MFKKEIKKKHFLLPWICNFSRKVPWQEITQDVWAQNVGIRTSELAGEDCIELAQIMVQQRTVL